MRDRGRFAALVMGAAIAVVAAGAARAGNAMNTAMNTGAGDLGTPVTEAGFQDWLAGFRSQAAAAGIDPAVLGATLDGLTLDEKVVSRDRSQGEFTRTIWDYLDSAVSDTRIANGRDAYDQRRAVLGRIEARYGVDARVLVAIWGLESAYGSFRGIDPAWWSRWRRWPTRAAAAASSRASWSMR